MNTLVTGGCGGIGRNEAADLGVARHMVHTEDPS